MPENLPTITVIYDQDKSGTLAKHHHFWTEGEPIEGRVALVRVADGQTASAEEVDWCVQSDVPVASCWHWDEITMGDQTVTTCFCPEVTTVLLVRGVSVSGEKEQ